MNKKVLQIKAVGNYGGGGMGEYIGREAIKNGWDSYIAYARNILPTQSKFIKIGNSFSIKEHALESRLFDNSGFSSRYSTKRFIKEIDYICPDIIHLHNLHGYYLNVKMLFEYLNTKDIPVVWTFHDCWPFTGHCAHFVSIGCDKWKNGCYDCDLSKSYPKSWFVDASRRNYNLKKQLFLSNNNIHIVTVSKWLEYKVRDSFFKGKDIRTIYNGVDINVFSPQKVEKDEFFWIIGVAFTWNRDKGLGDYIELSKRLKEDERIMLVGVNENIIKKLPPKIVGIKRTDTQRDLAYLYSKADVLTSLSYAETFGMTVAEANACGTPAIVYDNTAQPELILQETGFVAETGNIDMVYDCICKIRQTKKDEQDRMKMNCRKHALNNFNDVLLYHKYIDLYECLT